MNVKQEISYNGLERASFVEAGFNKIFDSLSAAGFDSKSSDLLHSLKRIIVEFENVIDNSPIRKGDKVALLESREYPSGHGWHCYNHMFKPEHPAVVEAIDIECGQLVAAINFDPCYWIPDFGPKKGQLVKYDSKHRSPIFCRIPVKDLRKL